MDKEVLKKLLEAGVHFGHQTKRWNPKMKRFIFGERNGIYIIDLQKTVRAMDEAIAFLKSVVLNGKKVLFVGTKKQAKISIKEEAERCGAYYVNERWLGGMLTNFATVKRSSKKLKKLEAMQTDGTFEAITKKEKSLLTKDMEKLRKNLSGVVDMPSLPAAVFVVDAKKEEIAIKEAHKLGIPVIALIDTNTDPDMVDYPIPGNDDAIRAIRLVASLVADGVLEAYQQYAVASSKPVDEVQQGVSVDGLEKVLEKVIEEETEVLEKKVLKSKDDEKNLDAKRKRKLPNSEN